jgi:hypothetical protein
VLARVHKRGLESIVSKLRNSLVSKGRAKFNKSDRSILTQINANDPKIGFVCMPKRRQEGIQR